MSKIALVSQLGGRLGPGLGGAGKQGPGGEKEAASEVCLASASPLAPESPFAVAPLHLHGHSGAHSPSLLAQNPPKVSKINRWKVRMKQPK